MREGRAVLRIELRSDLCVGSGFSSAGVIDQDVVYDKEGFPYIPARRLKGCMREAAKLVCTPEEVRTLFGTRGGAEAGELRISSALLEGEQGLKKELAYAKNHGLWNYLGKEAVLGFYTSVRAQTKIERATGTAEEDTLRFTRVVNQYDPFSDEKRQLCFYSCVSWSAESQEELEKYRFILKNTARATRHIGMNRNRGLGNIHCELLPETVEKTTKEEQENFFSVSRLEGNQVKISYVLENTAPLILSDEDKSSTAGFISGKSILGVMAGTYLKRKREEGMSEPAETEEFARLFLNGEVKYTNALPAIGSLRAYPAPLYLRKLKKTKKYVNLLGSSEHAEQESAYDMRFGNQPKKLKTQYVTYEETAAGIRYRITEPDRELIFHHRHQHDEEEMDALLYSQEVLAKGQRFAGEIYADAADVELLTELLVSADLRFGKSKSAQYGSCRLLPGKKVEELSTMPRKFAAGDTIAVLLRSDAIFVRNAEDSDGRESGSHTVKLDEVKHLLACEMGICSLTDEKDDKSMLTVTEIRGYHTLWNMRRSPVPAVCAGSVFVYKLQEDLETWPRFVGERTQEGYGEISVYSMQDMAFKAMTEEEGSTGQEGKPEAVTSERVQKILTSVLKPALEERLMLKELGKYEGQVWNASNIGRMTRMLKESLTSAAMEGKSWDAAAEDFGMRIQSIKNTTFKNAAIRLIEKTLRIAEDSTVLSRHGKIGRDRGFICYRIDEEKLRNMLKDDELLPVLECLPSIEQTRLLMELWGEYMLQLLMLMKYRKKGE